MLPKTFRRWKMLSLILLMLCLGSSHAASLRNERSVSGDQMNETISLPENFLMVLSLKGGVNQFAANILFDKVAFETLYSCLCQRDTYSCSGNVTFNYGTGYNYNTENITRVHASTAATMSKIYKCEIPNFGFLPNNRGGHFTCRRVESAESECMTSYWSIYIGQCDLDFANVIWDASHQASWNYAHYRNRSNRSVISSFDCHENATLLNYSASMDTSTATVATSPSDGAVTTIVVIPTTNPTNAHVQEASNDGAVIGGAVAGVVVLTALFVAGVLSCIMYRKKKKDTSKFDEQSNPDSHKPLPEIPTTNSNPARLYVIPERGLKPDDIPRWSHTRRKDDDDTTSSIYDVIGSGVYENGINENSNKNNNDDKTSNKQITNNTTNNKSLFGNSTNSDKIFNLSVTSSDCVPGYSMLGNKDNIHSLHSKLLVPSQDIKQRQRQPIPTDEPNPASQDSTGQDSSGFSLGRYFQENYNFLNRPAEIRRIANANNSSDATAGESNGRQNKTLSSEFAYPFNIDEYGHGGRPYFEVDQFSFPYNDATESGGTLNNQDLSIDGQQDFRVSVIDLNNCK